MIDIFYLRELQYDSRLLTKDAWRFLYKNPVLICLMLMSFLSILFLIALFFKYKPMMDALTKDWGNAYTLTNVIYLFTMALPYVMLYFLIYFTFTYFNSIIVAISLKRLCRQPASLLYGFYETNLHVGSLIKWVFFGQIFYPKIALKKTPIAELNLTTYSPVKLIYYPALFILPFILNEHISSLSATKRSLQNFGSNIWINRRVRSFIGLIMFVPFVLLCFMSGIFSPDNFLGIIAIWIAFNVSISTALDGIIKTAIYLYHVQKITPRDFNLFLLMRAVQPPVMNKT